MGIKGLLPVIKPVCVPLNVREFAHMRVGVDIHGWIHRGTFSCASKLCRNLPTSAYVDFCMQRVRMLIQFKARPVLVFDGAALPMKAITHTDRKARRDAALRRANDCWNSGNRSKAEKYYQQAVGVTSDMVLAVIRECRKLNVEYVVAPYEADAQLTWMMKTGYIDTVISEDSDLLVYGVEKVLFKMTRYGDGDMFYASNLRSLDSLKMHNFTQHMLMLMSVCAGCDFFKGVSGLGIKKSHALVKQFRTLKRLVMAIRNGRKYKVGNSFEIDFVKACLVFKHQTVYDMKEKKHIHLTALDDEVLAMLPPKALRELTESKDYAFLGEHRDSDMAVKIAEGRVHPHSLKEYPGVLDDIERPITSTPSQTPTTEMPKRPRITIPHPRERVSGFQVQPAQSSSQRETIPSQMSTGSEGSDEIGSMRMPSRTINLRQRLERRKSTSFNPRRAAAEFRRRNSQDSTSGIWSSFKSSVSQIDVQSSAGKESTPRSIALHTSPVSVDDADMGAKEDEEVAKADKCVTSILFEDDSETGEGDKENMGDAAIEQNSNVGAQSSALEENEETEVREVNNISRASRAIDRFAARSAANVRNKFVSKGDDGSEGKDSIADKSGNDSCNKTTSSNIRRKTLDSAEVNKGTKRSATGRSALTTPRKRPRSVKEPSKTTGPVQLRLSRFFSHAGTDS